MKNQCYTYALLILMAIPFCSFAQKLGTKSVSVKYTQLPLEPLAEDIQSYSTMMRSGYLLFNNRERFERDYLKVLDGYQHDASGNGDLMILATFRGLDIVSIEEKHSTNKDETTYNHRYEITYTFPVLLQMYDQNNNYLIDMELSDLNQEFTATFGQSEKFEDFETLDRAFKEGKGDFIVELENKQAAKQMRKGRELIRNNYALIKRTKKIRIGYGKGRKKNYSDLDKATDLAYRGYALMSRGEDGLVEFQQAIGIWKSALKETDLRDKKARINQKIARWLNYNCAMAYAWLDDYDSAMKYVIETEVMKHKGVFAASFNAAELRAFVTEKQKRYEANKKPKEYIAEEND